MYRDRLNPVSDGDNQLSVITRVGNAGCGFYSSRSQLDNIGGLPQDAGDNSSPLLLGAWVILDAQIFQATLFDYLFVSRFDFRVSQKRCTAGYVRALSLGGSEGQVKRSGPGVDDVNQDEGIL